jgi:hypothetical protein
VFAEYRLGTLLWAAGLVFFGLILLLLNFDVFARFEPWPQYILAALFATGAAGFFLGYFASRKDWARLIPAWTLLALAVMALTSTISVLDQRVTASLLFVGLAFAFANIYLLDRRQNWWAMIPGGFMLVIGLVIALSARITQAETLATLLFSGMGLVFLGLYWLGGRPRQWWALVPGTVLLVFGLFIFTIDQDETNAFLRLWPLLLIAVGLVVGAWGYRAKPGDRLQVNTAPSRGQRRAAAEAPPPAQLGDYSKPAPGAAVEILPDPDE